MQNVLTAVRGGGGRPDLHHRRPEKAVVVANVLSRLRLEIGRR